MIQTSVKMILSRFNARKFDAKAARQELTSLLESASGSEKLKLAKLIKVFRRPGFDTPQFKAALAEFQTPSTTDTEVIT